MRLRKRAEKALGRLDSHPESGRSVPGIPELPHREAISKPDPFFYRVEQETVWIVTVWQGAQLS